MLGHPTCTGFAGPICQHAQSTGPCPPPCSDHSEMGRLAPPCCQAKGRVPPALPCSFYPGTTRGTPGLAHPALATRNVPPQPVLRRSVCAATESDPLWSPQDAGHSHQCVNQSLPPATRMAPDTRASTWGTGQKGDALLNPPPSHCVPSHPPTARSNVTSICVPRTQHPSA